MSRIGKMPIKIPPQVDFTVDGSKLTISGPKGMLELCLPAKIKLIRKEEELVVESEDDSPEAGALHGLARALVANMFKGVSEGFGKTLELSGVGYRAQIADGDLNLTLGFSHPIKFKAPPGINLTIKENKIIIEGIDKQLVGEVASQIRRLRPPEPYKGKGIRYVDEKIRRKPGKVAKTIGGGK